MVGYGYFASSGGGWQLGHLTNSGGGYIARVALANATQVALTLRFNFGAQQDLLLAVPGGTTVNVPVCIVAQVLSATDYRIYVNGVQANGVTSPGTLGSFDQMLRPSDAMNGGMWFQGFGRGRSLTDAQALFLSSNPQEIWKLFASISRPIFVGLLAASSGPFAFTASLNESLTLTDTALAVAAMLADHGATLTMVDVYSSGALFADTRTESISAADSAVTVAQFFSAQTESITLADGSVVVLAGVAACPESMTLAGIGAAVLVMLAAQTESITSADAPVWVSGPTADRSEILATADAQVAQAALAAGAAEAVVMTAGQGAIASMLVATLESMLLADGKVGTPTYFLTASLTEALTLVAAGSGISFSITTGGHAGTVYLVVDMRSMTVPTETRSMSVVMETRSMPVQADSRLISVPTDYMPI
jgi:hypothetical protein